MVDFNSAYKFISVGALSLPVLWGVIYYMVEARSNSLAQRVDYLESVAAQGERFTRDDGERLTRYVENHGKEIADIRLGKAKIRESISEVRVMQNNVLYRVKRLEDAFYDHEHQEHNGAQHHNDKRSKSSNDYRNGLGLCAGVPCLGGYGDFNL